MIKKALLGFALLACLGATSCNGLQTAQNTSTVIAGILNVAQAEEPSIPAQDRAIYTGFVTLGQTLDTQLNTCISGVSGVTKSAAFATCFTTFASGLLSPTELAQMRILTASSQTNVQTVVTAVVIGVNGALAIYKALAVPTPTIAATPATTADLEQLRGELVARGYDVPEAAWSR